MSTNNEAIWTYKIIDGPVKSKIVEAFKYAYTDGVKNCLEFRIVLDSIRRHVFWLYTEDMIITSVAYEGDMGSMLKIGGYCRVDLGIDAIGNPEALSEYERRASKHEATSGYSYDGSERLENHPFTMIYDTHTHRGQIVFA